MAPEPISAIASMTVQPRRIANSRIASICIAKVCWSWVDTRAYSATRMGNTKPPGKVAETTIAFPGIRGWHIGGDKTLVLCQAQGTTCEADTQAGRTPGRLTLASRVDVA